VISLTHTQVTISYESQTDVEVSYPSDGRLTSSTDIEILFNLSIGVTEDVMFSMVDDLLDDGDGSYLVNISVDAYYSSDAWDSVEDNVDGPCSSSTSTTFPIDCSSCVSSNLYNQSFWVYKYDEDAAGIIVS